MAFGFLEAALVLAFVGGMSALLWYELKILRARRLKLAERDDLPEQAHNALVTTRAIRDTLGAGGVTSADADILLLRAESASERGAHRQVIELCGEARGILVSLKARQQREGDLARLQALHGSAEKTTKERLAEESPPHYLQAKFTLNLARDAIALARAKEYPTAAAESALTAAQAEFDSGRYEAALRSALQAKRLAEEALPPGVTVQVESGATAVPPPAAPRTPVEPAPAAPAPAPATAGACPQCGAPVRADDDFCRRCGTRLAHARACASCGTPIQPDDAFCRKCGAKA